MTDSSPAPAAASSSRGLARGITCGGEGRLDASPRKKGRDSVRLCAGVDVMNGGPKMRSSILVAGPSGLSGECALPPKDVGSVDGVACEFVVAHVAKVPADASASLCCAVDPGPDCSSPPALMRSLLGTARHY